MKVKEEINLLSSRYKLIYSGGYFKNKQQQQKGKKKTAMNNDDDDYNNNNLVCRFLKYLRIFK